MDLNWERSYPIYNLTSEELKNIFPQWKSLKIERLELITIGCRNSNYKVSTNIGNYLVRITSESPSPIQNELITNSFLSQNINLPKILNYKKLDKRYFIIYEYVEGENYSYHLTENKIKDKVIIQVAECLAKIHSLPLENYKSLKSMKLPPFESWYEHFLSNEYTQAKITAARSKFIAQYVKANSQLLAEIADYDSFIHSDFRPANMIITAKSEIFILDWEFCSRGHSLADIGQFFRYKEHFNNNNRELFARTYNNYAKKKLPDNWYLLSRLRDLINPLQLLSSVEKKLQQENDLLRVIDEIIAELKSNS